MKLTLRILDNALGPAGGCLVLCDEKGNMLPGQMLVEYGQGVSEPGTVTITFRIDGDNLRLDREPAA